MRVPPRTARLLAWTAIAAQLAFVAAWVLAGALEEGYSHVEQHVSELGAAGAESPAIVNTALVVLGLSFLAVALSLPSVLPTLGRGAVAAALFAGAGVAVAVAGLVPLDCPLSAQRCEDQWEAGLLSWQTDAHVWAGFASQVLLLLTPFALARALWPSPVGAAALGAGVFGVMIFAVALPLGLSEAVSGGLLQRVGLAVVHLWILIVAAGVLWETRGMRAAGELVPLRPREFMARAWTGEGELVIWPYFIGHRLSRRFKAVREATWLSERSWRFDDEVDYGDGRTQSRRTYCEFVTDDHVRLSAADLPDGADVLLEEGGYRIRPWRMTWPLGPIPVLIECHDRSRVAADGTFVNVIEARLPIIGLPLAQTRFFVRPADERTEDEPRLAAIA